MSAISFTPSLRGRVIDALHLRDAAAGAAPILPDGTLKGHASLRIAAQPAPTPPPTLAAHQVNVSVTGFYSWALLDRHTGTITGSSSYASETNSTESMIKIWITSDYLRMLGAKQPTAQRLSELSRMIRRSDDAAAQDIYQVDGGNAVIRRMISMCGLTETTVVSGWWSKTEISARDAVRLGQCVANGKAAGPKWTSWVLNEMRNVTGGVAEEPDGGRWGIIDGLPAELADGVAIKNGWTLLYDDGDWHVNCLAVQSDWVLSVLTRYPAKLGKQYGANVCKQVTQQLVTPSGA
nr:class A beta-lactamase-related serine hydrolase [Planosporangium thailandense]